MSNINNYSSSKEILLLLITTIYISLLWCSALSIILPDAIYTYGYVLIFGSSILINPSQIIRNNAFRWGCFYLFMLALAVGFHKLSGIGYGQGGWDTWLIEAAFLLPALSIGATLSGIKNQKVYNIIFWGFLVSLFLSLIYVIPALVFERDAARAISLYDEDVLDNDQMLFKRGFWNYIAFHIIALAFPLFWGLTRYSTGKLRVIATLSTLAILFIVIQISITTTFIYIFVVILFLVYTMGKRFPYIRFLTSILLISIFVIHINDILYWLLNIYQGSDMEEKITDFIDVINGGNGEHITIDSRTSFQQDNINAFLDSPIFGKEYQGGGHSVLWVRFATGGIFCGIAYLMMLISIFRQWYHVIPRESKMYLILSWAGACLLLYNKNTFGAEGFSFIAVILPIITLMYNNSRDKVDKQI